MRWLDRRSRTYCAKHCVPRHAAWEPVLSAPHFAVSDKRHLRADPVRHARTGCQKGTPNKITAEIKELAHEYGPMVIKELARLAVKAESKTARVAAIKELLDRGDGKAMQPIQGLGQEIARRAALPPPKPHC